MTCQNCARHAADALRAVSGVAHAVVDLPTERAAVTWQPGVTPAVESLLLAVKRAGFQASLLPSTVTANRCSETGCGCGSVAAKAGRDWLEGWGLNLAMGVPVTLILMAGEWGFGWGTQRWFHWLAFLLALPVQWIAGGRFYRGAWAQLKAGRSNMDTLVALGSTTAFGFSVWGLLDGRQPHLYFMEAAAILTLISLGHWLEARASARAASSLRSLLDLAPATARTLTATDAEAEVPVAQLRPGDRVLLKPGDRVPVDGQVTDGQSAVDEAILTGESLPVEKAPGSPLFAGTTNRSGRLVMRVTATGAETALAQIIAVVQRAQSSRASIQRLADAVSSVFVPTVVLVALGTALWWGLAPAQARAWHEALAGWLWHASLPDSLLAAALIHAAAVLIVACPCAMGLATPAAIMAGANAAARRGILIRDGTALEKSGRITAIAFDKTGTLTRGEITVAAVEEWEAINEAGWSVRRLAATLAAGSNHPLSRAIAALEPSRGRSRPIFSVSPSVPAAAAGMPALPACWTPLRPLREMVAVSVNCDDPGSLAVCGTPNRPPPHLADLAAWQEVRGRGVEARWQGHIVRLGALDWLLGENPPAGGAAPFVDEWSGRGATVVGLTVAGRLVGLFALHDEPKPQARDVIARLRANSKQVFLVTGDSPATAMAVANQLGIPADAVFAAVRPEGKSGVVADLQRRGWRVAFVGDGINDAPALEQADLGIAVSRASDVAREAADLILLRSDIEAVPEALGLAQATRRTIKQNLFWAFFYNAAAIPLAALGFLSPVICAAAMGLSDVLVIGNALRLLGWRAR